MPEISELDISIHANAKKVSRAFCLRSGLILLLTIGLGGITGCGSLAAMSERADSNRELRIGLVVSLSQGADEVGKSTIDAAQLAVQEINNVGGVEVGGRQHQVELITEDDQDTPEVAVSVVQKLINQEKVVAIVGPQLSRNAIPAAAVAERAQIPLISPVSTSPETTAGKRYVFRTTFVDPFQGTVMARFAFRNLGAQRAAVLYDIANAYNRGIAEVFKQAFEANGGEVVAFESYTTGQQDFSEQLSQIRDRQPDVLFLPNLDNEVPRQARQLRQAGITATLLGTDAWGTIPAAERIDLEGAYYSTQYAADSDNPRTEAFIRLYNQTYQHNPDDVAATTYDTMRLLFQAIQMQGKADPESIRAGLTSIGQFEGVTGTIQYRGTGDPARSLVVLRLQEGQPVFHRQEDPNE